MQPEKKFRAGGVTATIWQNANDRGTYSSVKLSRNYKDKDDNWKETNSFQANDIPKAMLVLEKAYEYIQFKEDAPTLAAVTP